MKKNILLLPLLLLMSVRGEDNFNGQQRSFVNNSMPAQTIAQDSDFLNKEVESKQITRKDMIRAQKKLIKIMQDMLNEIKAQDFIDPLSIALNIDNSTERGHDILEAVFKN